MPSTYAKNQTEAPTRYADYRDVLGVTSEEIEIIEYIKNTRDSLELTELFSSNAFETETGQLAGFSALVCDRLSELFGIPFNLTIREPADLIKSLDSRQADFSMSVPDAHRPDGRYFMADTGIERIIHTYQIDRPSTTPLSLTAQRRPLRLAFLRDSFIIHDLIRINEPFERIFVNDYAEALLRLQTGTIDAYCDYNTAEVALQTSLYLLSTEYLPLVRSGLFITTANRDLRAFIDVIRKYIANGGLAEMEQLNTQGYRS